MEAAAAHLPDQVGGRESEIRAGNGPGRLCVPLWPTGTHYPMAIEKVAVYFTEEEWTLLDPDQKALHVEVTAESHGHLISLSEANAFLFLLLSSWDFTFHPLRINIQKEPWIKYKVQGKRWEGIEILRSKE